jgi:hypothetical protein
MEITFLRYDLKTKLGIHYGARGLSGAVVMRQPMARLNDHQRNHMASRNALTESGSTLFINNRLGLSWMSGSAVHGQRSNSPRRVLLAAWNSDDSLR